MPLNVQNIEEKLGKGVYRISIFNSEKLDSRKCPAEGDVQTHRLDYPPLPNHTPQRSRPSASIPHLLFTGQETRVTGFLFKCKWSSHPVPKVPPLSESGPA